MAHSITVAPVIGGESPPLIGMKIGWLIASVLLAAPARAQTLYRSGPARANLIELYTSEGCSSCPPADAWLSSLKSDAGLWKSFVPVEFHVDYWDGLGWPDRFASPEFTARQRAYSAAWGRSSVYTPGLVLNGEEWRAWGAAPPAASAETGLLSARVAGGRARVSWLPSVAGEAFAVHAARLGFGLRTRVGAGENSGRDLPHDFVVRGLTRAALAKKNGRWTAELDLPPATAGEKEGVAVWVSGPDGLPLQAAGGFLP
jgi:hypothetical protein